MHHFSSVALVDSRGWILLQERDEHPRIDPEKWGFPGGHVEEGESYEAAAYRELAEETGVQLTSGLALFGEFRHVGVTADEEHEFQLFVAGTDLSEVECHEGRQMIFVPPAAALDLALTASAEIALPALLQSDTYRKLIP